MSGELEIHGKLIGEVRVFLVAGWVCGWMWVSDCLDGGFWRFDGMGVFMMAGWVGWFGRFLW